MAIRKIFDLMEVLIVLPSQV